jgi:hypothetical protein
MATINNIKKRAKEITNAYEPESVTAEKVGQLFEDIADVTEQTITSSEEVMQESVRASEQAAQAAEDASGYLADLQEAIENLPDGQAVSAQVAVNQTDIAGLKSKTGAISKQRTESEEEAIVYETDGGVQVGKIDANGADFVNLKRGGQQVARMSDLPTKDTSIGDTPSTTHVPTTKAVKDYVDTHSGDDYPIETETTQSGDEEQVWGNNAETQEYAKIGSYGMKSKAYLDMQGNSVIPTKDTSIGDSPSQTNVPTSKAVADYVEAHGGGDLPISREMIQSGDEEIVYGNNAMTVGYVKIGSYGIKAKAYLDLEGNPIGTAPTIYIGSTRQYTTLRAGIAAAVAKPNTKVIVDPEEFDLSQEFATEIASTLTREIGIKLGNGVHIYFTPGAKVKALMADRADLLTYFAPFSVVTDGANLTNSVFTLENLDIQSANTRYTVHDELNGVDIETRHYYINCKMVHDNYHATNPMYQVCIGGGCAKHTYVEIRNCYFKSVSAEYQDLALVTYHNSGTTASGYGAGAQSKIVISNSYFADRGSCRCTWHGVSTLMSTMLVNNCSFGSAPFSRAEVQTDTTENFELITYINEIRNNS